MKNLFLGEVVVQILNNKKRSVVLAGLALAVLSAQSQAAVTFTNYSYIDMAGFADDTNIVGVAGTSEYASTTDLTVFPAQATSYQFASVVDGAGFETAFADSDAWVEVDAMTMGNNAAIFGYVDSYSSAYAEMSNQDAYSYSDAVVDVDFTIDSSYVFNFGGSLMEASGNANLYYDLYSWDTGLVIFSGDLIDAFDSPMVSGMLSAGNYNLSVQAITDADVLGLDFGYASADFELGLTAVPVPAAVWLFGSGLLMLAGFMRRKVG